MLETISKLDAAVVKALLVAIAGLVGVVLSFFGVNEELFNDRAARLVEAFSTLLTAFGVAWALWARIKLPTPPVSEEAATKTRQMLVQQELTNARDVGGSPLRSHWVAALFAMLVAFAFVGGCTTTPAHVVQVGCASGSYQVERCADTLARVYHIYQQRALELVQDAQVPADVKEEIKEADAEATPVMRELIASTKQYMDIREALEEGATEEEKLAIANRELESWIAEAVPRINALIQSIGG